MNKNKTLVELIKTRKSRRNYLSEPLSQEIKNKITNLINEEIITPFNNKIQFSLIENSLLDKNQKIGSYGFISGASSFVAGKIKKSEYDLEDFGFAFEKIILQLTGLNLGTCWLGASFKKEEFKNQITLNDNEIIPAVTPVGKIIEKSKIKDKLLKFFIKANSRKKWKELFFNDNFNNPLNENQTKKYKIPLEMVRLAPSAGNFQPWRIVKNNDYYHFYISINNVYQKYLKKLGINLQRLDMGIAMYHFESTCKENGINGKWVVNNPKITTPFNIEYLVSWKDNS